MGYFFNMENTDGLHKLHTSGGTGVLILPVLYMYVGVWKVYTPGNGCRQISSSLRVVILIHLPGILKRGAHYCKGSKFAENNRTGGGVYPPRPLNLRMVL